jgi:hypothetical protein
MANINECYIDATLITFLNPTDGGCRGGWGGMRMWIVGSGKSLYMEVFAGDLADRSGRGRLGGWVSKGFPAMSCRLEPFL